MLIFNPADIVQLTSYLDNMISGEKLRNKIADESIYFVFS